MNKARVWIGLETTFTPGTDSALCLAVKDFSAAFQRKIGDKKLTTRSYEQSQSLGGARDDFQHLGLTLLRT
ncbi:hypothetical protein ElyMa_005227500 [Elysia marginata]|uniref:Uncharacterized protein n=1 Tax=Elysia marginata TaxID=1093978 RepID=A0AAV4JVN3_9GAST|nr:hypothetical protein ElyMa_005227500 [Elysia marginata]